MNGAHRYPPTSTSFGVAASAFPSTQLLYYSRDTTQSQSKVENLAHEDGATPHSLDFIAINSKIEPIGSTTNDQGLSRLQISTARKMIKRAYMDRANKACGEGKSGVAQNPCRAGFWLDILQDMSSTRLLRAARDSTHSFSGCAKIQEITPTFSEYSLMLSSLHSHVEDLVERLTDWAVDNFDDAQELVDSHRVAVWEELGMILQMKYLSGKINEDLQTDQGAIHDCITLSNRLEYLSRLTNDLLAHCEQEQAELKNDLRDEVLAG